MEHQPGTRHNSGRLAHAAARLMVEGTFLATATGAIFTAGTTAWNLWQARQNSLQSDAFFHEYTLNRDTCDNSIKHGATDAEVHALNQAAATAVGHGIEAGYRAEAAGTNAAESGAMYIASSMTALTSLRLVRRFPA